MFMVPFEALRIPMLCSGYPAGVVTLQDTYVPKHSQAPYAVEDADMYIGGDAPRKAARKTCAMW